MRIDCVLTACDLNPLYSDFIPIFIKAWTKLYPRLDIKIILIHPEIPERFRLYARYIICVSPMQGIPTEFVSQYIRLLYPAILSCKGGVLITDIDMMPMNATYYTRSVEHIDQRVFVSYRNPIVEGVPLSNHKQIPICYCVATPQTWGDIFGVACLDDVVNKLREAYGLHLGWCTDQICLYHKVTAWRARTQRFICLTDRQTRHRRLDRTLPPLRDGRLTRRMLWLTKKGYYSDYHMCRPYTKFKRINDTIFHFLPTSNI